MVRADILSVIKEDWSPIKVFTSQHRPNASTTANMPVRNTGWSSTLSLSSFVISTMAAAATSIKISITVVSGNLFPSASVGTRGFTAPSKTMPAMAMRKIATEILASFVAGLSFFSAFV